jgi:lipoyl(octanoyl) transferase
MSFLVLNSGKCDAAFNMALDEALLENVSQIGKPVLRFYGWTEPAATFGYFQKFLEVERATLLRPLIRRPTGGGIVPHDADWTYSFVVPPNHEWYALKAIESYRRIHEWIQSAFARLKIETELATASKVQSPKSKGVSACFTGHEKFDLLWRGKKIAGAAQRRNKLGLLIQGSVQPPPMKIARADWENAMRGAAREKFQMEWHEFSPDEKLLSCAGKFSLGKYSQAGYNQRRTIPILPSRPITSPTRLNSSASTVCHE